MKISYAVTVCNELEEIQKLIPFLLKYKKEQDEIVVLYDSENGEDEVLKYLNVVALTDDNQFKGFNIFEGRFKGHFADWKNKLNSHCTGDYIFQIDADEIPTETLITNIHGILEANKGTELFHVNRVNLVKGITEEHIQKWGWHVNELGHVNWPDRQNRIYKNDPKIKWVNKVHEVVTGHESSATFPDDFRLALIHPKDIKRQERQNKFYENL